MRRPNHYKDRNKGKAKTPFQSLLRVLPPNTCIVHHEGLFCGVYFVGEKMAIVGEKSKSAHIAGLSLIETITKKAEELAS